MFQKVLTILHYYHWSLANITRWYTEISANNLCISSISFSLHLQQAPLDLVLTIKQFKQHSWAEAVNASTFWNVYRTLINWQQLNKKSEQHTLRPCWTQLEPTPGCSLTSTESFYNSRPPPSEGCTPAQSTHNESCSSEMHWPRTSIYTKIIIMQQTCRNTKPHPLCMMPVARTLGHLARGSKAECRSNQSSQWATPLIQFCFISGEQTTREVCAFLGSCCRGAFVSPNDQILTL